MAAIDVTLRSGWWNSAVQFRFLDLGLSIVWFNSEVELMFFY
jgi:hypothetical protein